MKIHEATEQAYKNGYDKGYADATDNNVGSKWIPVTERLPREEWERFCAENDWDVYPCLVTIKNSRGGRYVTKLFFTGENFVDDEYIRYTAQVTHWMPLPEPPKGE